MIERGGGVIEREKQERGAEGKGDSEDDMEWHVGGCGFSPAGRKRGCKRLKGDTAVTHGVSTPKGTLRTFRCSQDRKYRSQFHHPMEPIISKLARSYVDADDLDRQLRRLFQARRFRCRRDAAAGAPRPLRRMRAVRPGHISAATRRRRRGRPAGPRRGPQRHRPCFPTIFSLRGGGAGAPPQIPDG